MGVWQTYIAQADTREERFYRLQRLTQAYADRVHFFANNRFFAKSILKYVSNLVANYLQASLVADEEDVFEFVIENKLGFQDAQIVREIAGFYERTSTPEKLRKADTVYRSSMK